MSIQPLVAICHTRPDMKEQNIRVENLKAMIAKSGGIAVFARAHDGVDPTYISQLINGHRNFGERAARKMEERIGLERGALDRQAGDDAPAQTGGITLQSIALADWEKLTPTQRKGIEEWVAAQVAAYLGTSVDHTGTKKKSA